jgi:hypothetical protein
VQSLVASQKKKLQHVRVRFARLFLDTISQLWWEHVGGNPANHRPKRVFVHRSRSWQVEIQYDLTLKTEMARVLPCTKGFSLLLEIIRACSSSSISSVPQLRVQSQVGWGSNTAIDWLATPHWKIDVESFPAVHAQSVANVLTPRAKHDDPRSPDHSISF